MKGAGKAKALENSLVARSLDTYAYRYDSHSFLSVSTRLINPIPMILEQHIVFETQEKAFTSATSRSCQNRGPACSFSALAGTLPIFSM